MIYFKRLLPITALVCCSLFSFASVTYAGQSYSGAFVNKSSKITKIKVWPVHGNLYTSSPSSGANCTPTNTTGGPLICTLPPGSSVALSFSSTRGKIEDNIQITPEGGASSGLTYISNKDNYDGAPSTMPKLCSGGTGAVCISLGANTYIYVCDASDTNCP